MIATSSPKDGGPAAAGLARCACARLLTHFGASLLALLFILGDGARAQAVWQELYPATSPGPLAYHAMAYDSAREVIVLFDLEARTWEWNGIVWTQIMTPIAPAPRYDHAMAYDSARHVTVLFGGRCGGGYCSDTWEYDGTTWTEVFPVTVPAGRTGHAMAFDSARGKTVMFGGYNAYCSPTCVFGDTWEWDGHDWVQCSPASAPPERQSHAMAFDSSRKVTVMFGGQKWNIYWYDDTWEWDGLAWTKRSPSTHPPTLANHAMAYDSDQKATILFGGVQGWLGPLSGDTWLWDGSDWQLEETDPATSPYPRTEHAMAYDALRKKTILTGGPYVDETWQFGATEPATLAWKPAASQQLPPPRALMGLAHDSVHGATVLYGGQDALTFSFGDTWQRSSDEWLPVSTSPSPLPLTGPAMTFDSTRGATVLFGGRSVTSLGYPLSDETWEWDGLQWLPRTPGHRPSARAESALSYDLLHSQSVLFGGSSDTAPVLGDTWLWDGLDWTEAVPVCGVSPSPRRLHAMASNPANGSTVLFGGVDGSGTVLGDTWQWDGSCWVDVTPAVSPPPRMGASMAYDKVLKRTLLFGGMTYWDTVPADTWSWDGAHWTQLNVGGNPGPRSFSGMAFDDEQSATVLFGGTNGNPLGDTWELANASSSGIVGHVLFEDAMSPVPHCRVEVYRHSDQVLVATTSVWADGSYAIPASYLSAGAAYDLLAVAEIPEGFWHPRVSGYVSEAYQPYDLDTSPDVTVPLTGFASAEVRDFEYPWPAILVHGIFNQVKLFSECLLGDGEYGPKHFAVLQPYLASSRDEALADPRRAVIPLVPNMGPDCEKSLGEQFSNVLPQVDALMALEYPAAQFQLVGYSQGGLVARMLLDVPDGLGGLKYAPRIKRLVQLGSPNSGTCVADFYCGAAPWVCPLKALEMAAFNDMHPSGHGIPCYLMAGTWYHPLLEPKALTAAGRYVLSPLAYNECLTGSPSDSVVSEYSVLSLAALDYAVVGQASLRVDHEGLTTEEAPLALVHTWLTQP